jgi:hypothetical protein
MLRDGGHQEGAGNDIADAFKRVAAEQQRERPIDVVPRHVRS